MDIKLKTNLRKLYREYKAQGKPTKKLTFAQFKLKYEERKEFEKQLIS
jgi:hypothetical protein